MKAYLVAGKRNMGEATKINGGLFANVGQTDRPLSERIKDPDYARKAAGGEWTPLIELDIDCFTDHDIHPLLRQHPGVVYNNNPNNTEEFLFKTDLGDGSVAIEIFKDVVKGLIGKVHQVFPSFLPRPYQESDNNQIIQKLRQNSTVLLSSFPGWGKSTNVGEIVRRIMEEVLNVTSGLVLVTTPAVSTLKDIKENLTTKSYGSMRFFVITGEEINSKTIETIKIKIKEGFIVVLLISVQGLRRGEEGASRVTENNTELCEKYEFLRCLTADVWIRDEYHKEYNGIVTCEVFKNIKRRYLVDMTATPYNLIEKGEYTEDQIVGDTMLNVLHKKKNGIVGFEDFPLIEIEALEGSPLRGTELGGLYERYSDSDEWDPRKLFVVENKQLIHASAILELNCRMYDRLLRGGKYRPGISKNENKLSITNDPRLSSMAKQVGMHILPEGNHENSARIHCELYVEICNADNNQTMKYVSSYVIEKEAKNRDCKVSILVEEKRKEALQEGKKGLIVVTHRKLLTGSDIPLLGHIVLLDKIGSLNEFMQALGRTLRPYPGKEHVRMYVVCPGISVSIRVYEAAKAEAKQYGDKEPKEYFDCLPITEYDENLNARQVDWDSAMDRFSKHQSRILSGDWYGDSYFTRYPDLDIFAGELNFESLGSGIEQKEEITAKTGARVTKRRHRGKSRKGVEIEWRRVVATLLNESCRIGFSSNSATLIEVFETSAARFEFGTQNTESILSLLKFKGHEEFYRDVNRKYIERMEELRSIGYE